MSRSLREELASLKIDRGNGNAPASYRPEPSRPRTERVDSSRGGFALRLLSLALWMIPLALLGGGGYLAYSQYGALRSRPEVSVGSVQTMTIGEAEKLLSAKGYLKSRHQAMIGAKTAGRVQEMRVEEGSRVKKGEILAILEHNDTKAVLESRKAMIERSEADLTEAISDLEQKERKARRWLELLRRQTATVDETDQYVSARDMAQSKVLSLRATIHLQKALLKESEETISDMHIIAPFDGTVVAKEAQEGETITPGGMGAASGRGSVVTVADLDQLEVETDIAETLLSRITVGQPAEISVSAVPGKHYRGRFRKLVPMGDRARGTVKVLVEVIDPDEQLFPELVATVHFLPDKSLNNPNSGKTFLFVPSDALIEESGHSYVWAVDQSGKIHRKPVLVATTSEGLARVESGLSAGESVVLKPSKSLREGELVKIAE